MWVSPTNSTVSLGVSPAASTPTDFYSQRLYFPVLEPWVELSVSLPSCSSWFIHMQMWDHPVHQSTALLHVLSAPAAHLRPSYLSGWMFLFKSLVVRLPYSLIFWQFWLFFVFKFVVFFFLVWGGKVCPPTPPPFINWRTFGLSSPSGIVFG